MTDAQGDGAAASPSTTIAEDVVAFVRQVDSLGESVELSMLVIAEVHKQTLAKLQEFEKENCNVVEEESHKTITVPVDHIYRFQKLLRRTQKATLAAELVPRSFLVALVSQYDAFLGNLIRSLFKLQPGALHASQKTLTLSDLVGFGTIDNAIEHIIDKEVESVLRSSHADQFDWLEDKFSIELRKGLPSWSMFVELTERRNLFVHTSGKVSHQYISVCKRHGVALPLGMSRDQQLDVQPAYFKRAHACVLEIGVKLASVLWRKVAPSQREAADKNLIDVTYDLLSEGRFNLAANLLDFATTVLKKYSNESKRLTFVVNRAQAYKWLGDAEKTKAILSAEDWSASADHFQMAEATLSDDFDRAIAIMRRMGASGFLSKADYRDWPLFRAIRKDERFAKAFEEIFGEALHISRVERTTDEGARPSGGASKNGPDA